MTILAGDTVFPANVAALMAARVKPAIDADLTVLRRPLKPSDPNQSVAIFPLTFAPDERSIEIQSLQPTLNRYNIVVQTLVKEFDEEAGISIDSILSHRLRMMFMRDTVLHAGLTVLSVNVNNSIERMQRRGISTQRYLSNEIDGKGFTFTSWMELWLETETTTVP